MGVIGQAVPDKNCARSSYAPERGVGSLAIAAVGALCCACVDLARPTVLACTGAVCGGGAGRDGGAIDRDAALTPSPDGESDDGAPEDSAAGFDAPDDASGPLDADSGLPDVVLSAADLAPDTAPDVIAPDSAGTCFRHSDCAGTACVAQVCAPIPGLVGHWRLDEGTGTTTADFSGRGNAGTLQNGTAWTGSGFGNASFANPNSVDLDGVDDAVAFGTNGLPAVQAAKTMSLWIRYAQSPGGALQSILYLANPPNTCVVQIGFRNGMLSAWKWAGGVLVATAIPSAGTWHHVAYTQSGNTHTLYVDGGAPITFNSPPQTCSVTVAGIGPVPTFVEFFRGQVDDLRIYDRALAVAEVQALATGAP